jgi:hypothetical protein
MVVNERRSVLEKPKNGVLFEKAEYKQQFYKFEV